MKFHTLTRELPFTGSDRGSILPSILWRTVPEIHYTSNKLKQCFCQQGLLVKTVNHKLEVFLVWHAKPLHWTQQYREVGALLDIALGQPSANTAPFTTLASNLLLATSLYPMLHLLLPCAASQLQPMAWGEFNTPAVSESYIPVCNWFTL